MPLTLALPHLLYAPCGPGEAEKPPRGCPEGVLMVLEGQSGGGASCDPGPLSWASRDLSCLSSKIALKEEGFSTSGHWTWGNNVPVGGSCAKRAKGPAQGSGFMKETCCSRPRLLEGALESGFGVLDRAVLWRTDR